MDQIVKELHEIEDSLSDLERKGVEMEKKLRSCEEGTFQGISLHSLGVPPYFVEYRQRDEIMLTSIKAMGGGKSSV